MSEASGYAAKSIGEKQLCRGDPYNPEVDAALPNYWPEKDRVDPVNDLFSTLGKLGLPAEEYEVAGALMRIEIPRNQTLLSQVTYISTHSDHADVLLQEPTMADLRNRHPVRGTGVILPKQFRDQGVLLYDQGYFSYQVITPLRTQEQKEPFYVAGFYDPGVISVGARCVLAEKDLVRQINSACKMSSIDPLLTNGIQVWSDLNKTPETVAMIQSALEETSLSAYWNVVPYYEYDFAKELLGQFQSDRLLFILVGILILIVACSNVISLLLHLVHDKKQEIGILLSLGAKKRSLAAIFGGIGLIVGLVSSFVGLGLAELTLSHIESLVKTLSAIEGREAFHPLFYDTLPNEMSMSALRLVLIAAPLLSFLAALVPAMKACRMNPSDILRHE